MEGPAAVERRIVSVLFADLVGFTALSERLDPEDVASTQDAYFAVVRETIGRHGGVLEKFIGDAAMAVFGVPRTQEDDAERAVRAGLALAAAVDALGPRLGMDEAALQVRVGISTGEVALAVDGPDAGRVSGDVVNVAARLQAAAPPGGVLLSEAASLAASEAIDVGPPQVLELKGKSEGVRAAAAIGARPARSRERAMGALRAEMVGRETEVAWLRGRLGAVAKGTSRTAVIIAPPGTGKSRFVAEATAAMLRDGTIDAVWNARIRPGGAPYEALRDIAIAASGGAPPSPEALPRGGLAPSRARLIAASLAALIDTGAAPDGGTGAVADWLDGLDAIGGGQRVIWIVEDLHWAGRDLLTLMNELDGRPIANGGHRLVLGTARPSFGSREDHLPNVDRLELPPLAATATRDLVHALVGDALPASSIEAIAELSAGNALFVEELLRTWVAAGTLVADGSGGGWRLSVPDTEVSVPTTVQAVYAAQIDDLAPDARMALRRASVAGRRFAAGSLPALDVPEPVPAVARLVRSGAVTGPTIEDVIGDVYAYRHALLRDAAYASLARAERSRLHVALARWLEEVASGSLDDAAAQIGGHYATALDVAPALARTIATDLDRERAARLAASWLERGGDRALSGSAPRAARDLYLGALRLVPDADPIATARLLLHLGVATAQSAGLDESNALLHRAMDRLRPELSGPDRATARSLFAEAAEGLSRGRYQQIKFVESKEIAEQAFAEIGEPADAGPDLPRARLLMRASIADHAETDADTSETLLGVVETAREAGDRRLELDAMTLVSAVRIEAGLPSPFPWEDIAAVARAIGDWGTVVGQLTERGLELADDHPAEALQALDQAVDLAVERGFTEEVGWADYARSEALTVLGDLPEAIAAAERAIALADQNGYLRLAVRAYHVLVPVAAARGDLDPARRLAAFYAAREGAFPDSGYARLMRGAMDLDIAAAAGRPPTQLALEPRLSVLSQGLSGASWVLAVERTVNQWLTSGQQGDAAQALACMEGAALSRQTSGLGRACCALIAGRVAEASERFTEAEASARTALAAFRGIPAAWWTAKALALLVRTGTATVAEKTELSGLRDRLRLA